jgi:hypothetical protein
MPKSYAERFKKTEQIHIKGERPFNVYKNLLLMSFEDIEKGKTDMSADFILRGNMELIGKALSEYMERHEEIRDIILFASALYVQDNPTPGWRGGVENFAKNKKP